jgi:hypothetical protein
MPFAYCITFYLTLVLVIWVLIPIMHKIETIKRMYDSTRWRRARTVFLADNPLCNKCLQSGRDTASTVVDHITPHAGDAVRFWDRDNWQALCATCHSGVKRIEDNHGHTSACGADGLPVHPGHPWGRGG